MFLNYLLNNKNIRIDQLPSMSSFINYCRDVSTLVNITEDKHLQLTCNIPIQSLSNSMGKK